MEALSRWRCGEGIVESLDLVVIVTTVSPYDGPHTTLDLSDVEVIAWPIRLVHTNS
jgi:hypothetical protein